MKSKQLFDNADTIIEVYDQDGLTLLASDDNSGNGTASRLEWAAPQDGSYFIRVTPTPGSSYGCSAAYDLSVQGGYSLYLPAITRD